MKPFQQFKKLFTKKQRPKVRVYESAGHSVGLKSYPAAPYSEHRIIIESEEAFRDRRNIETLEDHILTLTQIQEHAEGRSLTRFESKIWKNIIEEPIIRKVR